MANEFFKTYRIPNSYFCRSGRDMANIGIETFNLSIYNYINSRAKLWYCLFIIHSYIILFFVFSRYGLTDLNTINRIIDKYFVFDYIFET